MAGHAYRFSHDAATALLKALHLEDRKVCRIEIVFDVDEPVTLTVHEYAQHEHHADLCRVLTLGEWHETDVAAPINTFPVPTLPKPSEGTKTGKVSEGKS